MKTAANGSSSSAAPRLEHADFILQEEKHIFLHDSKVLDPTYNCKARVSWTWTTSWNSKRGT